MPRLHIANCNQQVHQFTYWLPEAPRSFVQEIPIGGQIVVGGRDLPRQAIDAILQEHEKYGLVSVADAYKRKAFDGLVYSVDRPVPLSDILSLHDRRKGVLYDRGKQMRQDAAIATNEAIQDAMVRDQVPSRLNQLEMSVEEVERDQNDTSAEISEGVRVVPDEQTVTRRSLRPRRAAKK